MSQFTLFILDDDPWYSESMQQQMQLPEEIAVFRYVTLQACLANLYKAPDALVINEAHPQLQLEEFVRTIRTQLPLTEMLLLSSTNSALHRVEMLELGVFDCVYNDNLAPRIFAEHFKRLIKQRNLRLSADKWNRNQLEQWSISNALVGESEAVESLVPMLQKVAGALIPVNLYGEKGTEKEELARAIHFAGGNGEAPFVKLNLVELLPKSQATTKQEEEVTKMERLLQQSLKAKGSTLFLQDIDSLTDKQQTKLMHLLSEALDTKKSVTRIITSSLLAPAESVKNNQLREDLYYRVLGAGIEIPALRLRGHDVLVMARHFLNNYSKKHKLAPRFISDDACKKLLEHNYPENTAELRQIVEKAAIMCSSETLMAKDIEFERQGATPAQLDESKSLHAYNVDILQHYLDKYNFDVLLVSKKLSIGKSTIYRMVQAGDLRLSKAKPELN